ncbi:hypothetical protein A1O3_03710 [Capronia epimyces CBS 606.96]|uniref:Major facilitator superfamily (MFS) profile domain-containing protein n=1 Tax=Capronia epimyces CBS 606.96 TaxID=1182542 RepID=W9YBW2_9EURO|nr:uncharacterized protein A1O3_03710 [Capronia epimyces CBS 606.96]EXJ86756.1 hypothetical protein A1O3_03710 [Capronia epimyces CBS 606.96]
MGLFILEPKSAAHVPGTVLLDQQAAHSEAVTARLKHGRGTNSHIVLAPQPSEDPNDPLNWSPMKKLRVLVVTYFGVIIHGVVPNPILNAGIVQIATELHRPVTDIALLSGYELLATGATGPFASAFARKYGKRPAYLLASIIGTVGVIVGETATGYSTLLAARVIQGIAVAAYEALGIATIGDLYFVHERGYRVAVILFILSSCSNFVSIVAGVITTNLGWHYNFHLMLPFAALQTVLFVLFAPETMFRRKPIYDLDTVGSSEDLQQLAEKEAKAQRSARHVEKTGLHDPEDQDTTTTATNPTTNTSTAVETETEKTLTHTTTIESIQPKKTWLQEMAVYNGSFVDDSMLKMVVACVAILFNVGAFWQTVSTGLVTAWYVAVAILSGVLFAGPPYLLSSAEIGYTSVGPFIGGLLGSTVCFVISSPLLKWLTRRNKGIYEPEFCLVPVIPGALVAIAGFLGLGYSLQNQQNVYVVCFTWGVILFGITFIVTFASQYTLDAFRNNSTEIFIMNMVFKNFFFYGLTNYIIQWYTSGGPVQVFGTLSGITAFVCLLLIPLYVYGKRYRSFWHHYNMLRILRLETDHLGADGGH